MNIHSEHTTEKTPKNITSNFAFLSMLSGLFACFSFFYPPMQLLLGSSAVILAYISKKGKPYSGLSIAGLITGIFSIVCSILMFGLIVYSFRMMKDPANAAMIRDIYQQYQELFKQFGYTL